MSSDFEAALRERLERNAELARQREKRERAFDEFEEQRREEEERAAAERHEANQRHHPRLVEALRAAADHLKGAAPEAYVVRLGWTESGEEFIAKISTRLVEPARSLFVELDRDDDEVLARWHSDLGTALQLWRLLEVDEGMLQELVLQVADQALWRDQQRPPDFPRRDE